MLSATVVEKVIKRKKKRASENIGVLHAEFGHMLVKFDDTSSGKMERKQNKFGQAAHLTTVVSTASTLGCVESISKVHSMHEISGSSAGGVC